MLCIEEERTFTYGERKKNENPNNNINKVMNIDIDMPQKLYFHN